ncbi:MAG: methyltransferase [Actinobacteria bacterium]|jgi:tRNA/tmRNA/rRNA uracil-C5-methylase (TrmA/RlmC/RlmD family)|nr:methyltransferase [Actinomycetota bacterium]
MTSTNATRLAEGDVLEVLIEKVAHGGHFIARHGGAVIFVRHAIPGERARIIITSTGASFNRGDVMEVLEPSPDRVVAPCTFAHRNGCGGCDFQHINLTRQRALKADVITEQFLRIASMEVDVQVEEIAEPLHWRTRLIATTNHEGSLGFFASRSHTVIPVNDCIIAVKSMNMQELTARTWKPDLRVEVNTSSNHERTIALSPKSGEGKARLTEGHQISHEEVKGKTLEVSQNSFWQSHINAPTVLTEVVLDFAQLIEGDHVLDLYGGVGLFTASMIELVGASGSIDLLEGSKSATADAKRNFANNPNVKIHLGDVAKLLPRVSNADVIVLDPPREGAGKIVVAEIVRLRPRAIVYVSCDPASLARDTAYLKTFGYSLRTLRAFDLFPMTHHVECVALYLPN